MTILTYHLLSGPKMFEVGPVSVKNFKLLWTEFMAEERFQHYEFFLHGGFVSYMKNNPQWQTKDVNIFIGRKRILDTIELYDLMVFLLELGEKYKLSLDIKYFPEHETPETLQWGTKVKYLSVYNKVEKGQEVISDLTAISEVMENNLFEVSSVYEMAEKDLERMNNGLIIYKAINLKKYNF